MMIVRTLAAAALVIALATPVAAQGLAHYRGYALESSVAAVLEVSGGRNTDIKTMHERPAKIQEMEWRAPYVSSGSETGDPVRDLVFSFYNDQLYQVVVTYDRDRMVGLTNDDVIGSVSDAYGVQPLLRTTTTRASVPFSLAPDATIIAQWEDSASLLTLVNGSYPRNVQLVLISKSLNARARADLKESIRLDTAEAPQRALDLRTKEAADAAAASQKARAANKAAFRP